MQITWNKEIYYLGQNITSPLIKLKGFTYYGFLILLVDL